MPKHLFQKAITDLRNNRAILTLSSLVIMISIILVFFSFGFVHHLNSEKQDNDYKEQELNIYLYDTSCVIHYGKQWTYAERKNAVNNELVQKKDVLNILCQLPYEIQNRTEYIQMFVKFKGDVAEDSTIDSGILVCGTYFRIRDGKIVCSDYSRQAASQLSSGRYFTKEEEEDGKLVCIDCLYKLSSVSNFIIGNYYDESGNPVKDITLAEKYLPTANGTYLINGKKYQCIGSFRGAFSIPVVPVATLDDNVYVSGIYIKFYDSITRNDYETICGEFQKKYGNLMSVYPLELPEAVTARFSNTLLVICLLIAFLSGSISAFIYQYLLQRSSRTFRIYRLCGMSAEQVRLLCFAEFISLQVFSVLIGLLGYHFILMPILDKSLVYLDGAYNLTNYLNLAVIYLATSLLIVVFMMNNKETKKTWVNI